MIIFGLIILAFFQAFLIAGFVYSYLLIKDKYDLLFAAGCAVSAAVFLAGAILSC